MIMTQYKSPPARLARLFERSRDLWKDRAAQKQRTIRSQRVTIRDLQISRDRWKAAALQAAQQLAQAKALAADLEAQAAASATRPLLEDPSLGGA